MHALRELLKSGEGKIRKIRTSSDQVHIAYDGSKYYFIEVCDNSSCHVIEADRRRCRRIMERGYEHKK